LCGFGASPNGVMLGRDGNLYGTTARGGAGFVSTNSTATGNGTVFALTPQGAFTTLVFLGGDSRAQPGGLIEASDGELCGTTRGGAVFRGLVPLATLPRPAFIGVEHRSAVVRYTFSTFPGGAYQVESRPLLSVPGWTNRGSPITVTGSVTNFVDNGTGVAESHFRVPLLP